MKNLIEVSVDSIRIHMPTAQHLVILKEKEADRYLPIWIGSFEAQAIATKISGNPLGRPLTHDLMATAFGDLGISVKRIVVTRLADQVFYARLYVKQDGRDLDFDARPSDAIALAVRVECPIFVATEVMETAGIIPDPDEDKDDKDKVEGAPIDEERLAVFRDFVNSLDLPDLPEFPDEPRGKDQPGGRPGRAEQLPLLSDVDFALRLFVTAILAIAIGFEREFHGHPAGIKTLGLVGVGACLFSGLGLEAFKGSTDPTRIAAQVVTGVGFLGAGAILRQGNEVHGLTTAASIWVVAAIGMAVGFGFYVPAIFTTLLILAMLFLLRPIEHVLFHRYKKIQDAVEVKIVPP